MATEVPKIVGQAAVAAAATTSICAPATGISHIVSSLALYNPNAGAAVVTVYARKAGAAAAAATTFCVVTVPGGATEIIKAGLTLDGTAGDILSVAPVTNGVTATAFGSELTR